MPVFQNLNLRAPSQIGLAPINRYNPEGAFKQGFDETQDLQQQFRIANLRNKLQQTVGERGSGRFGQMITMQQNILNDPTATPEMKAQAKSMLDYYNNAEETSKQQLQMMAEVDPQKALEEWSGYAGGMGGGQSVYAQRIQNYQLAQPIAQKLASQEPSLIQKIGEIGRLINQQKTANVTTQERDRLAQLQGELATEMNAYNQDMIRYKTMTASDYKSPNNIDIPSAYAQFKDLQTTANAQVDYQLELAKTQTELQNKVVDSAKSDRRVQGFNDVATAYNQANAMGTDFSNPANTYAMLTALAKSLSPSTSVGLDQMMAISGQAPHSFLTSSINEVVRGGEMFQSMLNSEEGHSLAEAAQKGAEYVVSPSMAQKISTAMGSAYKALNNLRENIKTSLANESEARAGSRMKDLGVNIGEVNNWINQGALLPISQWNSGKMPSVGAMGSGSKSPKKSPVNLKNAAQQARAKTSKPIAPKAPRASKKGRDS